MGALDGAPVGICVGAEEGRPVGEKDVDGAAVGCVVCRVFPITGFGLRLLSKGLKTPLFFFPFPASPVFHFHLSNFMCLPLFDFLLPFLCLPLELPPLFFLPEPLFFLLLFDFDFLFDFIGGVLVSQYLLPRTRWFTRSVAEQPQSSSLLSPLVMRLTFCEYEHPFCFPLPFCAPLDFLFDFGVAEEVERHFLLPRIIASRWSALLQSQSYLLPVRRELTI